MSENYSFIDITENDITEIVQIYNSNSVFLQNHLGLNCVTADFVISEMLEMRQIGFSATKIIDSVKGKIIGICDFKLGEEVYLSLLMVDGSMQGKGLGREIYFEFEQMVKARDGACVRIDVVDSYNGNAAGFWIKQGFEVQGRTELIWRGKKSEAQIMKKAL
jgi:ribosomal protein S18 acetylase RimI-like enzyme